MEKDATGYPSLPLHYGLTNPGISRTSPAAYPTSRAVLRGGGGGDVTSLPDAGVGNHPGLPGPAPHDQGKLWVFSLGRGKGVGKPVLMCPFAITRIGVMTNGVQSRKLDSRL